MRSIGKIPRNSDRLRNGGQRGNVNANTSKRDATANSGTKARCA